MNRSPSDEKLISKLLAKNIRLKAAFDLEEGLKMEAVQKWNRAEAKKEVLQTALTFIADIGYDYDGFEKVDSLKKLIDEMVGYARDPQSAVDALKGDENEGEN